MGLSHTVSEIDGDFSQKLQNPTPCSLRPRWRGSPWNWSSAYGVKKKLEWWLYGPKKKFDDSFSHLDTIHQRDGQTDRRTPGDSKDRAYA